MKINKINLFIILVAIIGTIINIFIKNENLILVLKDLSIIITINGYYIISKLFKIKLNEKINFIYVIFVFIAHFLGVNLNFYDAILGYDKLAHFLSGVLTTILGLIICINKKYNNNLMMKILFIISFSALIASLWEVFEYLSSVFFDVDPQKVKLTGIHDTMGDIIVAFLGSVLVSITYYFNNKHFERLIKNI